MKKVLLLSVVASTMIMAGGDIAPVEPVIETPAVVEASGWDFNGQAVLFTQTTDEHGTGTMFGNASTYGAGAIQLGATNSDIFAGIGAGVEVSAIEETQNSKTQTVLSAGRDSATVSQAYLTYGIGATSLKVGRQQLPKSLSPFAFSEDWSVFKNTFEAALVVNSSIPNTTLVYAAVTRSNGTLGDNNNWGYINDNGSVVHMVTAQNKSIDNLTLTGSYYYAPDMVSTGNNANILWGDATYKNDSLTIGVQGGQVAPDTLATTTAYGAKIAGNLAMFGLSAAYTSVNAGALPIYNYGTGVKTPLYTQSLLDQNQISLDSDTYKVAASTQLLGGKLTAYYLSASMGAAARNSVLYPATTKGTGTYTEAALMYKAKVSENTTIFAAYANQVDDRQANDTQNFVRFWARYNFN